MSIIYNDSIDYNQTGISYVGDVIITVPGLSSQIILSDVKVYFTNYIDHSNLTTIGLVTVNSIPFGLMDFERIDQGSYTTVDASVHNPTTSGIISLETDFNQAEKLAEANVIYIVGPGSGTTVTVYSI